MARFNVIKMWVFLLVLSISPSAFADKIVWHTVMDKQRNMPMHEVPLPSSWKVVTPKTEEDPNIIGEDGTKVYYRQGGSFVFTNDPYMNQVYMQSGQQVRQPINAQQIVKQDIEPKLNQHGLKLQRVYPLPEIAQRSQAYSSKLYKSAPAQQYFDAVGSEWVDAEGKKILIIVDQMVSDGQGFVLWYYSMKMVEAIPSKFANAKKSLIYSIVNTRDNPQQIQAYNLSEQQKANQSWSQHNARMQQNQRNFERGQALHRSTTEAINNSINSVYQTQNAASDRSQARFNNYIRDENTVTNPYDGQQYQVDAGSDQYWINNDGQYMQHNDQFYNPNMDPDNYQEWQLVDPDY